MEFIQESELLNSLPENEILLQGFRYLAESKFLLLKRGKILKRRIFRYISFSNSSICYYTSPTSTTPKGSIPLYQSIAIPIQSPIPDYFYCVKVISQIPSEFFVFCNSSQDQDLIILYIKLTSNNLLQQILDKACFNAIDQEFLVLTTLKTPKNLNPHLLVTPKNVVSRFLFSPHSDDNFDAAEENIPQKLPRFTSEEFSQYGQNFMQEDETIIDLLEENNKAGMESYKLRTLTESQLPEFEVLENAEIREIRELGVRYLWNYQLEYARMTFESIKRSDLRSCLYLAETSLFKLLITGRKSDMKQCMDLLSFFEHSFITIKDPYSETLQAELMLYKSIVLIISGQKFKAFISLRNCWKIYKNYENVHIEDPDIKARVELGLGIFLLLISLAPISISTILRFAGFSSDREKGMQHLQNSLNLNQSRSNYAGLILSLYFIDLNPQIEKATEIISSLSIKYPGCVLVHWVHSIISWKTNKIDSAIEFLNKALYFCRPGLSEQAAFIKYELGWLHFLRFEWSSARKQFEEILLETLSLSSDLDKIVKQLILNERIDNESEVYLEGLRKKPTKKDKKNWLDSEKTPERVYLPHKACLIAQLTACLPKESQNIGNWLRIIQVTAGFNSSKSTVDDDFAKLSICFQNRNSIELFPFEVIYFMKQHTKLLSYMLIRIHAIASEVIKKTDPKNSAEICSARMLQIMAMALNGDSNIAISLCEDLVNQIETLPSWASYLAPHSLYWCSRVLIAEGKKSEAEKLLKRGKRFKNYIFDIKCKIERVLDEMI